MVSYDVSIQAQQDAIAQMQSLTSKLQGSLAALKSKADQYNAANGGNAIENYADAQARWNQGMGKMQDAMTNKIGALGGIADNYVSADTQGASLFAR
jgi:WXG100 family type VII secretion target